MMRFSQMTWKEWGLYRQYVTGGGLIRDWLEQVVSLRLQRIYSLVFL